MSVDQVVSGLPSVSRVRVADGRATVDGRESVTNTFAWPPNRHPDSLDTLVDKGPWVLLVLVGEGSNAEFLLEGYAPVVGGRTS